MVGEISNTTRIPRVCAVHIACVNAKMLESFTQHVSISMKKVTSQFSAFFISAMCFSGASFAQAPATPAAPVAAPVSAAPTAAKTEQPAKAEKSKRSFSPQSAKAKACSAKADEQKLRGKERTKFRAKCKKEA